MAALRTATIFFAEGYGNGVSEGEGMSERKVENGAEEDVAGVSEGELLRRDVSWTAEVGGEREAILKVREDSRGDTGVTGSWVEQILVKIKALFCPG